MGNFAKNHISKSLILLAAVAMLIFSIPVFANAPTYYSAVYDGSTYQYAGVYATERTATSGFTNDVGTTMRIGQNYETSLYFTYRSIVYFDTYSIPKNAVITSATISLYGAYTQNTTSFNIAVISAPVSYPLLTTDYQSIFASANATLYAMTSSSNISMQSYHDISLNGHGINNIEMGGMTKFALVSEKDMAGYAPTNSEYLAIFTNERGSGYQPKLTIQYTSPDELANPDEGPETISVGIFTGYHGSGDQIVCVLYECDYAIPPAQFSSDFFSINLLDSTMNITASVKIPDWGYRPASIYLSPEQAIPWNSTYYIQLIGSSKFASPPSNTYALTAVNWIGSAHSAFDGWIISSASKIQQRDGTTLLETQSGKTVLNSIGGSMFLTGFPDMDLLKPHLFKDKPLGIIGDTSGIASDAYEQSLGGKVGAMTSDAFDGLGALFGVSGQFLSATSVVAVAFIIVGASTVTLGAAGLGGGTILGMIVIFIGAQLGLVPLVPIAVGALLIWTFGMYLVLVRGS